jgi:hypothetical protein
MQRQDESLLRSAEYFHFRLEAGPAPIQKRYIPLTDSHDVGNAVESGIALDLLQCLFTACRKPQSATAVS